MTEESANPAKLFIGNLSWSVREPELEELFGQYGQIVEVNVITDKFNPNRSKGMAFLEYDSPEAAQAAIDALHDYELDGRKMIVAPAKPKTEGGDRRGGGGYRGGNGGGQGRGGYSRGGGQGRGGYGRRDNNRSFERSFDTRW